MKKIIICYFASVGTLLGFTFAINANMIPFAVVMVAAFFGCMLWFCDIMRQISARKRARRSEREDAVQEHYSIDIPLDDEPEEKPVSTVRPGSRPSVTYYAMRSFEEGVKLNDVRRSS